MARFENRFSWSKSRHEKFESCRRQYYLHYYGSWGGWERDASDEVRELYLLKKLTNRWAWWGTAVHDAIKRVLSAAQVGQTPDEAQVKRLVHSSMRAQFRQSLDGAYRNRKAFGLVEHEYQEEIPSEDWRTGWEQVEACIGAFYRSPWLEIAEALPKDRWLPIDELGTFSFEGFPIYAAPDFAYRTEEGVVLVDWKTGRMRESDQEQLLGYALYARETWDVPLDRIQCKVVYLPDLEEVDVPTSHDRVQAFEERMAASIAEMQRLLEDPERNVATIDAFPRTENQDTCKRCQFRRPCLR